MTNRLVVSISSLNHYELNAGVEDGVLGIRPSNVNSWRSVLMLSSIQIRLETSDQFLLNDTGNHANRLELVFGCREGNNGARRQAGGVLPANPFINSRRTEADTAEGSDTRDEVSMNSHLFVALLAPSVTSTMEENSRVLVCSGHGDTSEG